MFLASMVTTAVFLYDGSYGALVLAIDVATLMALLALALGPSHSWTLWTAAFQLLGVATHTAVYVNAAIAPIAHAHALGIWSYLALASLAIGTWSQRRAKDPVRASSR